MFIYSAAFIYWYEYYKIIICTFVIPKTINHFTDLVDKFINIEGVLRLF